MENLSARAGTLRETFDASQATMANSLHIDQNLDYLKKIAEETERSRKLVEEQRDEAIRQRKEALAEAKQQRRNFYVSLLVTIVLGVVTIILAIVALWLSHRT